MMSDIKTIEAAEVQEKLEKGEKLHLIDVREDEEVASGVIPGAIHIRLGDLPERYEEQLEKDKEYIMICRSGRRSQRASEFLQDMGYEVKNMTGGMLKWGGDIKTPEE